MTYDNTDANADGIVDANVDNESVSTDEGRITDNQSVTSPLDRDYAGYAVKNDGTHFAFSYDGTAQNLYRTTDPTGEWTKVASWTVSLSGIDSDLNGIHITSNGTLLVGVAGAIRRSTDDGETFSSVYTLSNSTSGRVWSWDENSSGQILAVERDGTSILGSTDDGVSWSTFAPSTDFPNVEDHLHKVCYHPVNDWILVNKGDGSAKVWYRSTDGGSTWDEFTSVRGTQFVGIAPHPTDGNVYFLGEDTVGDARGIVRVTDDGSSSQPTQEFIQDFNTDDISGSATGAYSITTVHSSSDAIDPYYLSSSSMQNQDLIWASTNADGRVWRAVGPVANRIPDIAEQGAYSSMLDIDNVTTIVGSDRAINLQTAADPLYGSAPATGVDKRLAEGAVEFRDAGDGLRHEVDGQSAVLGTILDATGPNATAFYADGTFILRNDDTGDRFRLDVANGFFDVPDGGAVRFGGFDGVEIQHDATNGDLVFENPSGTTIGRLDSSGNLTISGTLTESGSP